MDLRGIEVAGASLLEAPRSTTARPLPSPSPPLSGYTFRSLTDNGATVAATPGANGAYTYTTSSVTGSHNLQAAFGQGPAPQPVPALGPWGDVAACAALTALATRRKRS